MDNFLIRCHVKIFLFLNTKKAIDFLSIFKGKSLQFLFEKVAAASAAEHFPWVAVYEMLGHGGIVLGFVLHTLSLGKVAAQQFVIVLIASAFMRGLRVTIVGGQAEGIRHGGNNGFHSAFCNLCASFRIRLAKRVGR